MEAIADALESRGCTTRLSDLEGRPEGDIVVVDSYTRRADDDWVDAKVVSAIDDLDRDLAVDVLVDPSPGATPDAHRRAHVVLAGGRYALVGPGLPAAWTAPCPVVERVLVTLGGHDTSQRAIAVAREISAALPDVTVAATAPSDTPCGLGRVRALDIRDGLGPELARADLVVCAGGVTLLEALRMGRPTVVVVIAENQRRAAETVAAQGAAVLATLDDAATAAVTLARDKRRRTGLSERASEIVDGNGPARVAERLLAVLKGKS
jgi:UDP-2,4-diacetamido-2,4,6-trideoxy-beta-L-altropyranose hydrolase